MSTAYLFEGLKAHYRARGLSYRDVAKALKISEATVKRIFSTRDCTLARLEELCSVVQVDLADIARGAPRTSRLITQLTKEQEQELVDDLRLLIVAACAMGNVPLEHIVQVYEISKVQCIGLLAKLDRIGFLELQENNHYRLRVARTFQWIPDGPIMRWTRAQCGGLLRTPSRSRAKCCASSTSACQRRRAWRCSRAWSNSRWNTPNSTMPMRGCPWSSANRSACALPCGRGSRRRLGSCGGLWRKGLWGESFIAPDFHSTLCLPARA